MLSKNVVLVVIFFRSAHTRVYTVFKTLTKIKVLAYFENNSKIEKNRQSRHKIV